MRVLVTGGAGYIGSHTVLELLQLDHEVIVIDDLSNSSKESISRVESITGKKVHFYQGSILNKSLLQSVFLKHSIQNVIHFAGYKAVGESVQQPLNYYQNNVAGTISLIEVMLANNVNNMVFSSSATVYGDTAQPPYQEGFAVGVPSSPYGQTKLIIEQILNDVANSNKSFKVANLRYFNPIGADKSGSIGEAPNGIPNNLLPFVAQVASGKREKLSVFGGNYNTSDGTCERDYVHVTDLAEGHIKALLWLNKQKVGICECFNLGTGKPYSVMEIIESFEKYAGQKIPYEIVERRAGDLPAFWADVQKAKKILNWSANRSLKEMIMSTWQWQKNNPNGY